jgi:threonine-phosphate decarboxylase
MAITHGGNIFQVSRERDWDWRDVADFSASINPLGPSPSVLDAIRAAFERIPHYPDRDAAALRAALAKLWNVHEEQILLGNGATELLHWMARTEPHAEVTLAVPVFSEFHRAYPDARCVDARDIRSWPREGLLVLTQPNNPTGEPLPHDELERWLLDTVNPVLIDESFLEFTGVPSTARLLEARPRFYVLRSLTKFYALPGLRVGALLAAGGETRRWRPMREPWQVNVLAEAAALAAIADLEHGKRTLEFVAAERAWLCGQLAAIPRVRPMPSQANYLFVLLDTEAAPLCRYLLDRRILIRDCTGSPGIDGEAVRVAVRTRPENERLVAAWREYSCAV